MTTIWELDFYSRPILDEHNKKVWEVLLCESPTGIDQEPESLFRYAQFCDSTQVNSAWLKAALAAAIAQAQTPPDKIRFFRQAMTNMITKACDELKLPVQLSRRTFGLNQWLQQRSQTVYSVHPGFQPGATPAVSFPTTPPQPLPAALMGEQWQIVSLAASQLQDLNEWTIDFGTAFPLSLAELPPESLVPGLLIFSTRAVPLAAWMSGLELAAVTFDLESSRLLLETGINDRWKLATIPAALQAEVQQFEAAKQQANGVHFLAVQTNPAEAAFAGFWLLWEVNLA
jgi:hypothetical protein